MRQTGIGSWSTNHANPHARPEADLNSEATTSGGQSPRTEEAAVANDVAKLQAELKEAKDRELRTLAELDNYRKRMARQMDEERRYANLPLLRDLLSMVDNLKRAVESAERSADVSALLEGVRMVLKQVYTVFERHHCLPIEALHAPFDPHLHHAVLQQPSADFPPNTVLHEVQPGFRLHDRVVRPAHVIVSSQSPDSQTNGSGEDAGS